MKICKVSSSTMAPPKIHSHSRAGWNKGCVLAPALFGIFFSLLLSHAFSLSEDGVYLHNISDSKLFSHARFRLRTKVRKVLNREMFFADDAALAAHTEEALHWLVNCSARAWHEFGLTISLKKTNIMHGPRRQPNSQHLHRWLHSRGGRHFHLPGFHHRQQPLFRRWAELKDRQGSNGNGPSGQKGLGQLHADHQNQDEGQSSLRAQHTALQQRNMELVLSPREQT